MSSAAKVQSIRTVGELVRALQAHDPRRPLVVSLGVRACEPIMAGAVGRSGLTPSGLRVEEDGDEVWITGDGNAGWLDGFVEEVLARGR